jgi:hypothetical protein
MTFLNLNPKLQEMNYKQKKKMLSATKVRAFSKAVRAVILS